MKKTIISICVSFVVLCLPSSSWAIITHGNPIPGNSWSLDVFASGIGNFDLFGAKISTAGDTFESPAMTFSQPGWALILDQPTIAAIAGPSVTSLGWRIHFTNDKTDPVTWDWAFFRNDNLIFTSRFDWNGTSLSSTMNPGIWQPNVSDLLPVEVDPIKSIPAPGAIVLGSMGVGLIGWIRRRRVL